jgi:DNA-binding CsgD family transcriptional regulator
MYLDRLSLLLGHADKLAKLLISPGTSVSDVSKFLALDTFAEYKPSAVHVYLVTDDGYLAPAAYFGLTKETANSWGNISLSLDAPLTDAVKSNEIIQLKQSEAAQRYPILQTYEGVPEKWETYLVTPVIPHGVFALTLHSSPEVDQEFETFLRTIGTLIMLHQLRQQVRIQSFELKSKQKRESKHGALTTRQLLIRRLIEKGHTNAEIADQIGYSESLVRHETMEIYAVLNVSGRKELLDNSGGS